MHGLGQPLKFSMLYIGGTCLIMGFNPRKAFNEQNFGLDLNIDEEDNTNTALEVLVDMGLSHNTINAIQEELNNAGL